MQISASPDARRPKRTPRCPSRLTRELSGVGRTGDPAARLRRRAAEVRFNDAWLGRLGPVPGRSTDAFEVGLAGC